MEDVNLRELPRRDLKQLCNEHGIPTAGVKHEDLVCLLQNKLYPPAPNPPRSSRARIQVVTTLSDSRSLVKGTGESDAMLKRSASQGRSLRTPIYVDESLRDAIPERSKKALLPNSRKPLTKSNSTPTRRSDILHKKVSILTGVDKQSQENAYIAEESLERAQQTGKISVRYRGASGAPRPFKRTEAMGIERPGELPLGAPRLESQPNKLPPRKRGSKLAQDVSLWNKNFDNLLESSHRPDALQRQNLNEFRGQDEDSREEFFPAFSEGSDFLVGDTDGLDSFLDADDADPKEMNRPEGRQVGLQSSYTSEITMARGDYDILGEKRREYASSTGNAEAVISTGHSMSELEDLPSMDCGIPSLLGTTGITDQKVDVLPSASDERIKVLSTNWNGLTAERPNACGKTDFTIAGVNDGVIPVCPASHGQSLGSRPSQDHLEDNSIGACPERPEPIRRYLVEELHSDEPSLKPLTIEEIGDLSGINFSYLSNDPHHEGREWPKSRTMHTSDSVHLAGLDLSDEGSSVGLKYNNRSCDAVATDVLKDVVGTTEELNASRDTSRASIVASSYLEGVGNDDSSKHKYSRPAETTTPANHKIATIYSHSAPHSMLKEGIDAEVEVLEPEETTSSVECSSPSDSSNYLKAFCNTVGMQEFSPLETKRVETREADPNVKQVVEPLRTSLLTSVTEIQAKALQNYVEKQATSVKPEFGAALPTPLIVREDSIRSEPDENASKTGEQQRHILHDENTKIAAQPESFSIELNTMSGEPTRAGPEYHKDTSFHLSTPPALVSERFSPMADDSVNVSQNKAEFCSSKSNKETGEVVNFEHSYLYCTGEIPDANSTINTDEGRGVFTPLSRTLSAYSTDMQDHGTQTASSQGPDNRASQEDRDTVDVYDVDSAPNNIELPSRENSAPPSHPQKFEHVLTVGLKVFLVIGTLTLGIVKLRAFKLKLGHRSRN